MLTVRLLGRFEILRDEEPILLVSRPAQTLLAYLLLNPGIAHRREKLAGIFWPEISDKNARNRLRHALWRTRKAIPDSFIHADRVAITCEKTSDYALDVDQLRRAEQNGAGAPDTQAAAAYGGELLPGFYADWVGLEREYLAALYIRQMDGLLDQLTANQDWRGVIEWAERWIAHGQTPERAYRALMLAHASLGNQAAAAASYQRCVDALRADLDVPPSGETEELYAGIRQGRLYDKLSGRHDDEVVDAAQPHRITNSALHPVISGHLPAPTTPLVGRAEELAALAALFADPDHRLVTILGPGGMGKTRLALAAAEAQRANFADGVYFVPLAGVSDPEGVVAAIAAALGFAFQESRRPLQEQLRGYLHSRRMLLLLDNFEHLLAASPLMVAILEAAPHVKLLVTSRARLRLRAETILRLDGMQVPPLQIQRVGEGVYSAFDLFVQGAQRLRRDFAAQDDAVNIAHICRLMGGMPLGILLAASWIDVLEPGEIADEIGRSLDFLQVELHDLDPRHRSLAAALDQSWQRLSAEEQAAFCALAVFPGGFDRAAALSVAEATLPNLILLVDRALLRPTNEGRYAMHEVVRQFARSRLDASGEAEAIAARHCAHYANLVAHQIPSLYTKDRKAAREAITREDENVVAAWRWAAKTGDPQRLEQMNEGLAAIALATGRSAEVVRLYDVALAAIAGRPDASPQRIRLACAVIHLQIQLGQWGAARRQANEAIQQLASLDPGGQEMPREWGLALQWLAHLDVGANAGLAQQEFSRALIYFRACGDAFWTARMLIALGWSARQQGDFSGLQTLMHETLTLSRANADDDALGSALEHLAFAAIEHGRLEEAADHIQEGLAIRQREGILTAIARAWRNLGVLRILQGRFADGDARLSEAAARYRDLGEESGLLVTTVWQGMAQLHLGDYAQARRRGKEGLERAHSAAHQGVIGNGLLLLGSIALAEREYAAAETLLNEAVEKYRPRKQKHELAIALCTMAYAQHRLGDGEQTLETIRSGLALVTPEAFFPAAVAAPLLALLLHDAGKSEQAVELCALAQRSPYIANSRWFNNVAGKELNTVALSLPEGVRAGMEARGPIRNLQERTRELLASL